MILNCSIPIDFDVIPEHPNKQKSSTSMEDDVIEK